VKKREGYASKLDELNNFIADSTHIIKSVSEIYDEKGAAHNAMPEGKTSGGIYDIPLIKSLKGDLNHLQNHIVSKASEMASDVAGVVGVEVNRERVKAALSKATMGDTTEATTLFGDKKDTVVNAYSSLDSGKRLLDITERKAELSKKREEILGNDEFKGQDKETVLNYLTNKSKWHEKDKTTNMISNNTSGGSSEKFKEYFRSKKLHEKKE
jgi:hypothetical protein